MKPTPTPDLLKAAVEAVWKYSLVIESSVRRGDGPDQYAGVVEALQLVKDARAALSVPAAAVVGEPVAYRWKLRENCPWGYSLFARDDVYVCEPLYAAPSAPDGYVEQLEKALKLAADRLDASSHRIGENDSRAAFGIAQWAIEARAALGGASHE